MIKTIPTESLFGLYMFIVTFLLSWKILARPLPSIAIIPDSEKAGMLNFANLRARFFDDSLANLPATFKQVVLLGAGLDRRALLAGTS